MFWPIVATMPQVPLNVFLLYVLINVGGSGFYLEASEIGPHVVTRQ